MQFWIHQEEWYPVNELQSSQPYYGYRIELTQEEADDVARVFDDFERIQVMLSERRSRDHEFHPDWESVIKAEALKGV